MSISRILMSCVLVALAVVACGDAGTDEETTTSGAETGATTTTMASEATTTSADGEEPSGGPVLADTSWSVTHHASEIYGGITNVWPDTEITLAFGPDGTVSGNSGCNDYQGVYELSGPYVSEPGLDEEKGQAITITELSWTERSCESENVMEQEGEYLALLPRVEYWLIGEGFNEGENLLLRAVDDGLLIEATATG